MSFQIGTYNYFKQVRGTAIGSWLYSCRDRVATLGNRDKDQWHSAFIPQLEYVMPTDVVEAGATNIRATFSSLHDFLHCPFRVKANETKWNSLMRTPKGGWSARASLGGGTMWTTLSPQEAVGAESADEAARMVEFGWPEGAARVFDKMSDIDVPVPENIRRKMRRGDQGDELDIHSVYRGDLDRAWTSRRREHSRSKMTVRIITQSNQPRMATSDQIFWRGAAVVKLADMLTTAGYNVEILNAIAIDYLDGKEMNFLVTFPLKISGDPLDCEQLAGVVCHSGFHRLFGFRSYNALIGWKSVKENDASIGSNASMGDEIVGPAFSGENSDGVHTFPTAANIYSKENAQAWIAKCVAELETENS